MNRMFIKHFGYTPKEYRKRLGMEQKEISQITREFETIYSLSESIGALEEYQKTHA